MFLPSARLEQFYLTLDAAVLGESLDLTGKKDFFFPWFGMTRILAMETVQHDITKSGNTAHLSSITVTQDLLAELILRFFCSLR